MTIFEQHEVMQRYLGYFGQNHARSGSLENSYGRVEEIFITSRTAAIANHICGIVSIVEISKQLAELCQAFTNGETSINSRDVALEIRFNTINLEYQARSFSGKDSSCFCIGHVKSGKLGTAVLGTDLSVDWPVVKIKLSVSVPTFEFLLKNSNNLRLLADSVSEIVPMHLLFQITFSSFEDQERSFFLLERQETSTRTYLGLNTRLTCLEKS